MIESNLGLIVGTGLVSLGLVIIFFSPYRRWLSFLLAGMVFWSFLELSRISSQYVFNITDFQGYMIGIGAALTLLASWLAASDQRQLNKNAPSKYIEHTPVYDNDMPNTPHH